MTTLPATLVCEFCGRVLRDRTMGGPKCTRCGTVSGVIKNSDSSAVIDSDVTRCLPGKHLPFNKSITLKEDRHACMLAHCPHCLFHVEPLFDERITND